MYLSREADSGSEITPADNGPGFEPTGDGAPPIAPASIRQRLTVMCNGRRDIIHRDGGGTVVRVTTED